MAAKTRAELRALVRAQLDMDADELTDALIDPWLEDGFERTLAVEDSWPFLEHHWDITTVNDQVAYTKASLAAADADLHAIDNISSLLDITSTPFPLAHLPHDRAEQMFGLGADGGGVPAYWSEWGGSIHLWQAPDAARTVRVRGYRKPSWATGDAVQPDADARLHMALFFFACAMAYSQQEDEVLSASYMQQWQDAVRRAHDSIMAAPQRRPLVMSGTRVAPWNTVRLVP